MAKTLIILESPSKAKTVKKILGSNYKIEACVGHVRDLPKSSFGVDVDNDFEPKYITIRGKGDILANLRKQAKSAKKVYLATDPDREGEAISWHLIHALKLDEKNTERIVFNEITQTAVKKALKEARKIDMDLVDAQQARRILDRMVGYRISPLLWKKVKKGLSAGRVQSVVLKLVCDREEEIEQFIPEEYWTLEISLSPVGGKGKLTARYSISDNYKKELKSEEDVQKVLQAVEKSEFQVAEVKHGSRQKKPPAPFTTSTLQQEASKLFGYPTSRTMRIAQQLYEGVDIKGEGTVGLISYIRTDSPRISDEAYEDAKALITENYGENYLPPERVEYKSKGRTQDAHEAIRPTNSTRRPETIKASLSGEQFKLYKLIWERFIGSQMAPAHYDTLSVKITAGGIGGVNFRSSGSVLTFDGYLAVYSKNEDNEKDVTIPAVKVGDRLNALEFIPLQHFTQPPPRFSEGNMVRTMEELGIGRPGTFAQTITTLMNRGYITRENKVMYPTELGEIVNEIMTEYFENIVDVDFTAKMENALDSVELGEEQWKNIVREFYPPFAEKIQDAEEKIGDIEVKDEETDVICELCSRNMVIKFGRFGKFLACPGFPDCRNAKPLFEEAGVNCPLCDSKVVVKKSKKGRKYFGCEKSPDCEFISWNLPTGEKCPDCGQFLVEKGRKKRVVACSACAYAVEAPEVED
ncbi:MAG: type I DNA topoisomerase [Defluviitaleaceae bacterium]|nr:type I DNA topoisomerase [Defluviitaleaceae bacterium]